MSRRTGRLPGTSRKHPVRTKNRRGHSKTKSKSLPSSRMKGVKNDLGQPALHAGMLAGVQAKKMGKADHFHESWLQQSFLEWCQGNLETRPEYRTLSRLSHFYCSGYQKGAGRKESGVPLLLKGRASAVVCASNEEDTLSRVLHELERLPLQEIIVVLNGCQDKSFSAARKHPLATIVHYPAKLGHDVGRSVGAALTHADIVLFTDGDVVIPAEEMAPFMYAVDGGVDVALNELSPYLPLFVHQDEVTRCKSFLNTVLGRGDLGANSLTAVPHALSSRLITDIGADQLMIPPKAQALALSGGYRVDSVHSVDVFSTNRKRPGNTGSGNAVAGMIIGDHEEALFTLMERPGSRLFSTPISRKDVAMRRNA